MSGYLFRPSLPQADPTTKLDLSDLRLPNEFDLKLLERGRRVGRLRLWGARVVSGEARRERADAAFGAEAESPAEGGPSARRRRLALALAVALAMGAAATVLVVAQFLS